MHACTHMHAHMSRSFSFLCLSVSIYVCVCTCTHTHTMPQTQTHTQTYTSVHTHAHTHIYTHTHTYIHKHTDTHAHTHTYTHEHTHRHIYLHTHNLVTHNTHSGSLWRALSLTRAQEHTRTHTHTHVTHMRTLVNTQVYAFRFPSVRSLPIICSINWPVRSRSEVEAPKSMRREAHNTAPLSLRWLPDAAACRGVLPRLSWRLIARSMSPLRLGLSVSFSCCSIQVSQMCTHMYIYIYVCTCMCGNK